MFVSINRISVKADSTAVMEEKFGQSKGLGQIPGFRLKRVWAPHNKDESAVEYLTMTHWKSKEDFFAWPKAMRLSNRIVDRNSTFYRPCRTFRLRHCHRTLTDNCS